MISVTLRLFRSQYRRHCLAIFILMCYAPVQAQDEWIDYVVAKDTSMLSISMDLKYYVQKPNYKNLLIVGTTGGRSIPWTLPGNVPKGASLPA